MKKEINPRWHYDCCHCKFAWCCGPLCQCNSLPSIDKTAKDRRWYSIKLGDDRDEVYSHASGRMHVQIAEISPAIFKVGDVVTYQMRGRKKIRAKVKKIEHFSSTPQYKSTKDQRIAYYIHLRAV